MTEATNAPADPLREALGITDADNMVMSGEGLDWLMLQLAQWPTRVDQEKTTNMRYLMQCAALTLKAQALSATREEGGAIPVGMKPWHGGDSAPEDWDRLNPVLLADGELLEPDEEPLDWSHHGGEGGCLECWCIVAYTPTTISADGDKVRLDFLAAESFDLRNFPVPTGGDDADIGWRVVGHWQAKPNERTIAEVFHDDPRAAIDAAMIAAATAQTEAGDGA
jgi:hypothetical protein